MLRAVSWIACSPFQAPQNRKLGNVLFIMWVEASLRILMTSVVLLAFPLTAGAQSLGKVERFEGGELIVGRTYTATFIFVEKSGWRLAEPVKILPHHAIYIEWIDRKRLLPTLFKENRYQIEFKVVSKNVKQAGNTYRWNTTYRCALREAIPLIPSIEVAPPIR
jgi:hypothetical protein